MIVLHPNEILTTPTKKVEDFNSEELRKTMEDLLHEFQAAKNPSAVGLAANQVGSNLSVAIVSAPGFPAFFIINPVITKEKGDEFKEESCLSIPGVKVYVHRATTIWLTYQDPSGQKRAMKAKDFLARVIQHEVDHLNGLTILRFQEQV